MGKKELEEVKIQVEKFRDIFKDDPVKHIQEGTWFTKVLQMVLKETPQNLDAKFFKKKYLGLNKEQKARQLVKTTANYTAIAGASAAGVVSAAEISTVVTGGWSLTAAGASLIGEISFITYLQLRLVYEVSILLDAKLDRDDPEDILTLFWFALGVNIWDDISNVVLKAGPRSAEYLGRKALRTGVRKGMQNMAARIGGQKLAQKITERSLIKLIVPGVNIPIAALVNRTFTMKLGDLAIEKFKTRGAIDPIVQKLMSLDRYYGILTVPLIYHVGIFDNKEKKGLNKVIEVQSNATKRLNLNEEEESLIDDIIQLDFNEFCSLLNDISNQQAKNNLFTLSVYTDILKGKSDSDKISLLKSALGIKEKVNYNGYKSHLGS